MSLGADNYGPANKDSSRPATSHDAEPADPEEPNHSVRRNLPLIPDSVSTNQLPDPLVEDGKPLTVKEAGETYLKIQQSNRNDDTYTPKCAYHRKELYPRILEADRYFRNAYDGLTTVMLTRRLSPVDDSDSWLTPWECNAMLHGGHIHRSINQALRYQLDAYDFEWLAVTAPTRGVGTPHEHIYIWVDDPTDAVTTDQIVPARDKHLKYCVNAYEKHHQYRADGTGGAITIQHSPDLVDKEPDKMASVLVNSQTSDWDDWSFRNTRGSQYLASQLTHLHIADYYDHGKPTPPKALFEGAALSWASPYNWFRTGRGVP